MAFDDVILIHPPSVLDFRERPIFFGPISDVIPSTPIFEMYPVGFLTLAAHLRRAGYRVRIVNLAVLMLHDPGLDPEVFLAGLDARLFGVDLHWLPHVHGALGVAEILKRRQPDVPVVMGGLSASYFHDELVQDPNVDFVLRGSSAERELEALVAQVTGDRNYGKVPGLTWRRDGGVRVNPELGPPTSMDDLRYDLGAMVRQVVRDRNLWEAAPFLRWWHHPITPVFTVRGCARGCVSCGAGRDAFPRFLAGQHPFLRSPESIARQVQELQGLTRATIFFVGDVLDGGRAYAEAVLDALARTRIRNELKLEFFQPPPAWFVERLDETVPRFSAEISPESHDPSVRAAFDKASYTNTELEEGIEALLATSCRTLDLYYMIGLPLQDRTNALASMDHAADLLCRFDRRLTAYVSPMGPFLDPASPGFEDPEAHGYRLFARTLAEHRKLLESDSWETMLNYETRWMTRHDIVEATYDAAERLNEVKRETGRVSAAEALAVRTRLEAARALGRDLASDRSRVGTRGELEARVRALDQAALMHKGELFPVRGMLGSFRWWGVVRALLGD